MGPLRCVVELDIQRVSAPGVWLPRQGDVYLSISLFGHTGTTTPVSPYFPLVFHENFRFEKTYYTAIDTADVELFLEDELIEIELLQMANFGSCDILLASYYVPALDFLYPYRTIWPSFHSGNREFLMKKKTLAYPFTGLSPRVEFTSSSVIRKDLYSDTLEMSDLSRRSRSRSRALTRALSRSLSRSRSLTRTRSRSPSPIRSCLRRSRYDTKYDTDFEITDLTPSYIRPRSVSPYRSWLNRPLSSYRTYSPELRRSYDDLALDYDRSYQYRSSYPSYLY